MNLYPEISNVKKKDFVIKLLIGISAAVGGICVLINELTYPNFKWSWIVVVSIFYVWATTMYSIRSNTNIGAQVMIQSICVGILIVLLDYIIGYRGWSIYLGLPIIISTANITMCVLTIVSRHKFKYALYQILLFFMSLILLALYFLGILDKLLPFVISMGIILINNSIVLLLSGRELKEELRRTFHI